MSAYGWLADHSSILRYWTGPSGTGGAVLMPFGSEIAVHRSGADNTSMTSFRASSSSYRLSRC